MDVKRFFEQQISLCHEAARRTATGIARSQDRDRLNFYQARLAEAKTGRIDAESFATALAAWSKGKTPTFDLELQSIPEDLFRDEVKSAFELWSAPAEQAASV
jgi:hypothetical protein